MQITGQIRTKLIFCVSKFKKSRLFFSFGSSIHEYHQHAEQLLTQGKITKSEFPYRGNEEGDDEHSTTDDDSTSQGTPGLENDPDYGPSPIGYQFDVERRKQGKVQCRDKLKREKRCITLAFQV